MGTSREEILSNDGQMHTARQAKVRPLTMDGNNGLRNNRRKRIGAENASSKVSPLKVNTFRMNSIDIGKPST